MTDVQAALEAHIASARRHGATPENALRAGRLFLRIIERRAGLEAVKRAWEAALAKLERQGPEGKAAALELRLELLSEAVEAARMRPMGNPLDPEGKAAGIFEGKSFFFPAEQDADFERLLRAIGGYRERGAEPGPGGFDDFHFARAMALIDGAEPEGDAERKALERFRAKHPRAET